ncbi:MAG: hypothetical protein KGQ59_00925, partial [Bdellovibrionales bacterium]|nr:hypothetical protein [Bdellovibrionales bacterium]
MIYTLARFMRRKAGILTLILAATACSHLTKDDQKSEFNVARQPLTHAEAQLRSRQISRVRYGLWFALNGSYPDFEGRTVVQFYWKPEKQSVGNSPFLDF